MRPRDMLIKANRELAEKYAEQDRRFWDDAAKQIASRRG